MDQQAQLEEVLLQVELQVFLKEAELKAIINRRTSLSMRHHPVNQPNSFQLNDHLCVISQIDSLLKKTTCIIIIHQIQLLYSQTFVLNIIKIKILWLEFLMIPPNIIPVTHSYKDSKLVDLANSNKSKFQKKWPQ